MLLSYLWLNDFIKHSLSPEELAEKLTWLGIETNIVDDRRGLYEKVVIGTVESCSSHPKADTLRVTRVNIGNKTLSIVCGAPNVAEGQTVAVALEGAVLPGGMKIEKREFRGKESEGMICSERELGISEESAGIMVIDGSFEIGAPLREVIEIEDVILEVDLTPNRGDCLSILGIAREVSAVTGAEVNMPSLSEPAGKGISDFNVEIKNPHACPRYTAREIGGVTTCPSPLKIRRRLLAVGIRPINNIVDATNYVMMETGHPLHAFDRRDLKGKSIIVRNAHKKEKFTTLDEKEHSLDENDLVIADAEKSVALAGIMGGLNSEIKDDTTDIILEVACFNPVTTRKTAKRLGIYTDSSYRFERGVNPETVPLASIMCASHIAETGGGRIGGYTDLNPEKFTATSVKLRTRRLNDTLGTELKESDISALLKRLGFEFTADKGYFEIKVPPYRPDISEEADFIEEVARLYGYLNIKPTTPRLAQHEAKESSGYQIRREVNRLLSASGLNETINYSFINSDWRKWARINDAKPVLLKNPISSEMTELRTSLLPGLLNCASFNIRHGEENVSIFETGTVFSIEGGGGVREEFRAAGLMTGGMEEVFGADMPRNLFRLKGVLYNMIKSLTGEGPEFARPSAQKPFLYTHRQLDIIARGIKLGFLGQVHTLSKEPFEIPEDLYCFEISVERLIKLKIMGTKIRPLPRFPGIKRDLAIIVDEREEVGEIVKTILKTDKKVIRSCRIFDHYQGKQIPEGKKSLAFRLYFQNEERTLTDEAGDAIIKKILDSVKIKHKAVLRS